MTAAEKNAQAVFRVVAALIENDECQVLLTQRRPEAFMPLKWEFPGGKVEPGESDSRALVREIKEELGIEVEVGEHFMGLVHDYTNFSIDFHVYYCRHLSGVLKNLGVNDFRWVDLSDLDSYDFPPADQPSVEQLLDRPPPGY